MIDLSPAGHQPMVDLHTGNRIVYNGEVYNFRDIRRSLESRGIRFRSDCDTEVLLQAYAAWGTECVRQFRGMFAFAIWDETEHRLFLARDRLGIKPLYYYQDASGFLFASELRALLASGQVPREISAQGLTSYLAFGSVSEPHTIISGVRMLPPGHTALFDGNELVTRRYWGLDGQGWTGQTRSSEVIEAVRAALLESVQLRLVSDVPIGAFLSGGIDSSAVVALMAQGAPARVRTVTLSFEEGAYDESHYADVVARQNGTDHRPVVLTAEEVLRDLDTALTALDQPSIDGLNTWFVSRAARQSGLTVALSGLGGDELFAGYHGFRMSPRLEYLRRLAAALPVSARELVSGTARKVASASRQNAIGQKIGDLLAYAPEFEHATVAQRSLFGPQQIAALTGESDPSTVLSCYKLPPELLCRRQSPIRAQSVLECGHYMRNTLLRDTDTMSMAHALEVRVPLLDHLLVELVLGLEDAVKVQAGRPKPLLVSAMGNAIPSTVTRLPKKGFTLPMQRWLHGPLAQKVQDALRGQRRPLHATIDPEAVSTVWEGFEQNRMNWSRPWALFVLSCWAERHLA